jgi:signal transduction histidine kinase/CHASE3 domain sensor protein/ActR/RegA family two-component response regulator
MHMPSQRFLLGFGVSILLMVSAASIGLEVKSRYDTAWVDHALRALQRLSDLRLLMRSAESAARGFALTDDPSLRQDFIDAHMRIPAALNALKQTFMDDPDQMPLVESSEALVTRRLAVGDELLRLRETGDDKGLSSLLAKAEGRALTGAINSNFDRLLADEERLLAVRTKGSQSTRGVLLAIDLAGAALILMLAVLLTREARRSSRELETALRAAEAANQGLEAAVAERTEHLLTAHEQLRHSASILQSTFNGMAEAVLVIDTRGEVLLSNPAAERFLRYRPGSSTERLRARNTIYRADGVTLLPEGERPIDRAMRGEQFEGLEVVLRQTKRRDPLHVVISSHPLHDAAGAISGAALVYHDISASRETERKFQQAQKLDAIGKLTGGVAHDFNNMLTVITGATEALVAGLQNHPELQETAEQIDRAAERCAELIQHLLAFARRQPLQPRSVDINGAVRDMAKLLRPTLGEQIEIETELDPSAAAAHIDPSQLAHALLNMAINARDAMPGGGKLVLETRDVVLDEAYARDNPDVRPGPYVMLAVSDSGTGMPDEVRDRAFEPFFTTKDVGKGSGLGLSMVYGFVKQSGGHIKIYSEQGHGTTIRLYLPPAAGAAETDVPPLAPTSQGGSETILVVEDDSMVRNFVTAQLQSLGYKTVTAADSRAALAHVASGERFDLLFTDVIMPGGITGRELAEEVSKQRPGTKVLYTSGYTDNSIMHHGRLDEGVTLLAKPYRRSQLAQMVRQAIGGEAIAP